VGNGRDGVTKTRRGGKRTRVGRATVLGGETQEKGIKRRASTEGVQEGKKSRWNSIKEVDDKGVWLEN